MSDTNTVRSKITSLLKDAQSLQTTNDSERAVVNGMIAEFKEALALLTPEVEIVDLPRAGKCVKIPAGKFLYGPNNEEREIEEDFLIQLTHCTVGQYEAFCKDVGLGMPPAPSWGWDNKDFPMVNVTWWASVFFAIWSGGFLPTEEQWEKAARGTDGRIYPWGNTWDASKCANSVEVSRDKPAPVGSFPEGASPYGVLDMAGNAWQWCANKNDAALFAKQMGIR